MNRHILLVCLFIGVIIYAGLMLLKVISGLLVSGIMLGLIIFAGYHIVRIIRALVNGT